MIRLLKIQSEFERDGIAILPHVFDGGEIDELSAALAAAFESPDGAEATMHAGGEVYAARNVLELCPLAGTVWRTPPLLAVLHFVLGTEFGLVRALFFDKPPDRTWAASPGHKDLTIAVEDNQRSAARFTKPTRKAGVPHVEAPLEVLQRMLTARIHLDAVTEENGPLKVAIGSHRSGKELEFADCPVRSILAERGDVLLMRPLVAHCSGRSAPDTRLHRRILHLEFSGMSGLPDGYRWRKFLTYSGFRA